MLTTQGAELALQQAMRAARPYPLTGPSSAIPTRALAEALVVWAVGKAANLALQGVSTGTPGVGTISTPSSKIILAPNDAACLAAVQPYLKGPVGPSVATALSMWVSVLFSTQAQYVGNSTGVGIGTDLSRFVLINQTTLEAELARRIRGAASALYAQGIASAIVAGLRGAVGTAQVVGIGMGPATTGTTFSVVF